LSPTDTALSPFAPAPSARAARAEPLAKVWNHRHCAGPARRRASVRFPAVGELAAPFRAPHRGRVDNLSAADDRDRDVIFMRARSRVRDSASNRLRPRGSSECSNTLAHRLRQQQRTRVKRGSGHGREIGCGAPASLRLVRCRGMNVAVGATRTEPRRRSTRGRSVPRDMERTVSRFARRNFAPKTPARRPPSS
jgi:hypothetical protein